MNRTNLRLPLRRATQLILIAAASLGAADACRATSVFSQQKPNTTNGQLHQFVFTNMPPSDGTGGKVSITLNGDYSPRGFPPLQEGATVTFESVLGSLQLWNNSPSASASNAVAGLLLDSSSLSGGGNNVTLGYVYSMSGPLLNTLLADQTIAVNVQNTSDVTSATYGGFVKLDFTYTAVPECSTAALAGAAALALLARRGRFVRREGR